MYYKKIYENLVVSRQGLKRKKKEGKYYERHHIIPKCCGGDNSKENLVLLTFKEHYIAHLLLSKMYDGDLKKKMCYAFWRMSVKNKHNEADRILSASQYEKCKEAFMLVNVNRIVSKETRLKMRKAKLGYTQSEEHVEKRRLSILGKTHTDETKSKMSVSNFGKIHSSEHIEKYKKKRELRRLNGEENKTKMIPIIQLDKNGSFIKEWKKVTDIEKKLKISHTNICSCLKGRLKTAGGFKWEYKNNPDFV